MSNAPQGPGWWQAADGNWYPPPTDAPPGIAAPKKSVNPWIIVAAVGFCVFFLPCAGGVAYFAIGGGTTTTTRTGPAASSPTSSASPSSTGGGGASATKASPAPVGTEVMAAKDWFVTVTTAEVNADATLLAINPLNTPSPGKRYVLVTVKVDNKGDQGSDILSNIKLSLLTTDGEPITTLSCLAQVPDRLSMSTQLEPGGTVTGRLCFEMDPADIPGTLMVAEPLFTLESAADQRFLAIS